ncbi:MAG TPA: hypothetical protein VLF66_06130, partial [Thermoanaerobaculia bacterium]|nr:hypothetical protein [Thermoanaerobaculia bacterium]
VRLRADALRPDTYSRMDTRMPGLEGKWTWRTPLLGRLGLGRPDLGIVGWTATGLAACSEEALFLPVRVRQNGAAEGGGYRAALVPGERLRELSWSVAPVDAERPVQPLPGAETSVGYGYYPAGRPTVFDVPGPGSEGVYVLRLRAQLRSGGRASRDLCFYHPGPPAQRGPDPATAGAGSPP